MSSRTAWMLALGAGALLFGATRSSAPAPADTVPGQVRLRVQTRMGTGQVVDLDPQEILLFFTEYRSNRPGRPGTTVVWTRSYGKLVVFDAPSRIEAQLDSDTLRRVHIRPSWLLDPHEASTDEVVPILVAVHGVDRVEPSSVISHEQKAVLGRLVLNGYTLDVLETFPRVRQMFGSR